MNGIKPPEVMKQGEWILQNGAVMKYRLFVPEHSGKIPVVLYLHGSGFKGNDNIRHIDNGYIRYLIGHGGCIVLAPQCPINETWMGSEHIKMPEDRLFDYSKLGDSPNCTSLKLLTDTIVREYSGDADRIYLIGRSMGAHAIWRIMQMYPCWPAANVTIAGGADLSYAKLYRDKNIWMFHGSEDSIVPLSTACKIYDVLKAQGSSTVRLSIYQDADHMSVDDYVSENEEMYCWLFSKSRHQTGGH